MSVYRRKRGGEPSRRTGMSRAAASSSLAFLLPSRRCRSLLPVWNHQECNSEIDRRGREEETKGHEEEPVLVVAAREAVDVAVDRTVRTSTPPRLEPVDARSLDLDPARLEPATLTLTPAAKTSRPRVTRSARREFVTPLNPLDRG